MKNISIIIPTLNSEKTIERCLNSLMKIQNLVEEIIIIDGISKDNTKKIVKNYMNTIKNIKLFIGQDLGISDAFNKGISKSNGFFKLIIGSDDYINPTNFQIVYDHLQSSNKDIIFTGFYDYKNMKPCFTNLKQTKDRNSFTHPGTFISSKAYELVGNYSLKYKVAMDYDFFTRFLKISDSYTVFKKPFVIHCPGGKSSNKYLCMKESFEIRKKYHNAKIPMNEFFNYVPIIIKDLLILFIKKIKKSFNL